MNPRAALLSLLAVVLVPLAVFGQDFDPYAHTKVGDKMPEISVDQAPDGTFSLAAQRGKVVLVNFWATWCEPCQVEMPDLETHIWRKYKSSPDFAFIAIARQQDKNTVLRFRQRHENITFPLAWDPTRAAYSLLASGNIPRTYIVDRRGVIVYQDDGYAPDNIGAIDRAIQKALAKK